MLNIGDRVCAVCLCGKKVTDATIKQEFYDLTVMQFEELQSKGYRLEINPRKNITWALSGCDIIGCICKQSITDDRGRHTV